MENLDLANEVKKLQFHIQKLMQTINTEEYPIEYLILSLNLSESEFETINDIFEEYDQLLQKNIECNLMGFERKLKEQLTIGYQTVKQIVLAFYDAGLWKDVCIKYAKLSNTSEFRRINELHENITEFPKST